MRIVGWNIRAGGGVRAGRIAAQLEAWRADVVALSEFRDSEPSRGLADDLASQGLIHQRSTAGAPSRTTNALLIASRWPLRTLRLRRARPPEPLWLLVRVRAPRAFAVAAVHVPNRVSGRKEAFQAEVLSAARGWRGGPAVLIGDTNSGRIGVDEEAPAFNAREDDWMAALEECGWRDGFRLRHGDDREYTWYSPNGRNGFRLDQVFCNEAMRPDLRDVRHEWGRDAHAERRDALSDHAALIVDFDEGSRAGVSRRRRRARPA